MKLFAQYLLIYPLLSFLLIHLADGLSSSPPPSPFSVAKEKQLLANTHDNGERNVNHLFKDENNQKLDSLEERLGSLCGENMTSATSALRNSTKHNVPSEKTAPLPSQANKMCGSKLKKRTRPAGKTCWW